MIESLANALRSPASDNTVARVAAAVACVAAFCRDSRSAVKSAAVTLSACPRTFPT